MKRDIDTSLGETAQFSPPFVAAGVLQPSGALFALVLFALGLSACAGDGGSTASTAAGSPSARAEAALRDYLEARSAGRWRRACSYLSSPIRHLLTRIADRARWGQGRGCAAALERFTESLPAAERADLAKVDVISVRVERERGQAFYETSGGASFAMPLKSEGNRWRLAAVGGTPVSGSE